MTKIVKDFPPNYSAIWSVFRPGPGTVFAYGDAIYSPSGADLPAHLVAHEEMHLAQQRRAGGPDAWWQLYIESAEFRLEQEVEAYRAQLAAIADLPRARRREVLAHVCKSLASRLYGGLVTKEQARQLVTQPSDVPLPPADLGNRETRGWRSAA